jgi:hypothetical protein
MAESEKSEFLNYDDDKVYEESTERALNASTENFVVEFGVDEAQIAFDLGDADLEELLRTPQPQERPVRWM